MTRDYLPEPRMTHEEASFETLDEMRQDIGNFAIFADMITRKEDEQDEV